MKTFRFFALALIACMLSFFAGTFRNGLGLSAVTVLVPR